MQFGEDMESGQEWDGIIEGLRGPHRLRVWSVIVTVFGDAVLPRGGTISLQALQEIMARFGVEPGAVRTALSRLASEGWVIRQRRGRLSHYSLDVQGRRSFDEATQRIYASGPVEWDGRWTVAIPVVPEENGAAAALEAAGFVSRSGTWLRPEVTGARPMPEDIDHFLIIKDQPGIAPSDAYKLWDVENVADAVADFLESLRPLEALLDRGEEPAPLDAIALRTLLIHQWRRIVLRAPALPIDLLPPSWPALEGRMRLKEVYARLVPASEEWLNGAGLPPLRDPERFAARFGRR